METKQRTSLTKPIFIVLKPSIIMTDMFSDLTPSGMKNHTGTHECKCAKCSSQFNGDVMPQRKTLCPVDKHFKEIL